MIKTFSVCLASLVVSVLGMQHARAACEPPTLIAPNPDEMLVSNTPLIAWLPGTVGDGVDIELVAYVPEGEVVHRVQHFIRHSHWQPTLRPQWRELTLLVRARTVCGGITSEPTSRRFHLDLSHLCPEPRIESATLSRQGLSLVWNKAPTVQSVEMVVFENRMAPAHQAQQLTQSPVMLQWNKAERPVLGLRSFCSGSISDWAWVPVAVP